MAEFTTTINYTELSSPRFITDLILNKLDYIKTIAFVADPHYIGYVMQVDTQDYNFQFIREDF